MGPPTGNANNFMGAIVSMKYFFEVSAILKNTGHTVLNSVILNCQKQTGFYICNSPYLHKKYENLGLQPGDSILLEIGKYYDNKSLSLSAPLSDYVIPNFCVWPSVPNDSWNHHNTIEYKCITNIDLSKLGGVGISESSSEKNIEIFPNPATHELNFKVHGNNQAVEICIYNSIGQVVKKHSFEPSENYVLDIAYLPPGLYIAEISSNTVYMRKKVIKK